MHWIVAYAGWPAHAPHGTAPCPALEALLARWRVVQRDDGDVDNPSMPHERAWARAMGFEPVPGLIPWGRALASEDGLTFGEGAVALLSPTHWRVTADHVALLDPEALQLDDAASQALWTSVATLMQDDGYSTQWGHATRWYASHADWADLPSASIDRVVNQGIEPWQPTGAVGRRWQRLQNEMQMVLHTAEVNDDRATRGLWPVNSVWLSGNGPGLPTTASVGPVHVDRRLRTPYLASDVQRWLAAWQLLDAEVLTPWLTAPPSNARLTLCGERSSISLSPSRGSWWRPWMLPRAPNAAQWLAQL